MKALERQFLMAALAAVLAAPSAAWSAGAAAPTLLVIDTSASMRKEGRAEAARLAAALYVQMAAPHGPIGLVTFAEAAQVVAEPRQLESEAEVRDLLQTIGKIGFDGKWTSYRVGLEAALKPLEATCAGGTILFLTDGDIDPDPADPFHQTEALKAELAKAPRCGDAQGVRIGAYGAFPPHAQCEGVYRQLVAQSTAKVEKEMLPVFKRCGVQFRAVPLQVTSQESLGFLRRWSSQTGGTVFMASSARELPRRFAEAFAGATSSVVETVRGGVIDVEKGIRQLQVVAASSQRIELSLSSPAGPVTCGDRPLADCFVGEGFEARGGVARVSAPVPGRWNVKVTGPGAAGAEIVVVKRYDLSARMSVDGKPVKDLAYLDEADVRRVELEVVSGAGLPLPPNAHFLRGMTAKLHLPYRDQQVAMAEVAPGRFAGEVTPPPAVLPEKKLFRDQEPPRRVKAALFGEASFGGGSVRSDPVQLLPGDVTIAPEANPVVYQGLEKPFPVAMTTRLASGQPVEPGRLSGAEVVLRQGSDEVGRLPCDADGRCKGNVVRRSRVSGPEAFEATLVRKDVTLGAGKLHTQLKWGLWDYFQRYGLPLLGALALATLAAGRFYWPKLDGWRVMVKPLAPEDDDQPKDFEPGSGWFQAESATVGLSGRTEGLLTSVEVLATRTGPVFVRATLQPRDVQVDWASDREFVAKGTDGTFRVRLDQHA